MTVGSRVHGTIVPIYTGAGPTELQTSYGTKQWNGGDYGDPPVGYYSIQPNKVVTMARAGDRQVEIDIVNPLPPIRKGVPPRRARTEEHPYSMEDRWVSNSVYRKQNPYGGIDVTAQQDGASPTFHFPWSSDHEYQLLGRLRQAVAGSDFNAGVFLGEGREALNMIANSARRIGAALYAVRRGDPSGIVDAARILTRGTDRARIRSRFTASDPWLQLQYGWLPLLSDAHSGAEFLAHHLNVPLQKVIRVSSRSKGSATIQNSGAYEGGTYQHVNVYQSVRIKAILTEKDVAQLSGLTDPLSVAWNLLPYSFVVDWFLPIGSWLESRGLASALTGTFVRSQFRYGEVRGLKLAPWFSYPGHSNPAVAEEKVISVVRTVSSSLSVPLPEVKPLGEVMNWRRAANAVALLTQATRRFDK